MKAWWTPKELAYLPDMPGERQIRTIATRLNWRSQKHQGKGGGLEYHFSSLPKATQAYLLAQEIADHQPAVASSSALTALPTGGLPAVRGPFSSSLVEIDREIRPLADWQRKVRDGRLAVLALVDHLARDLGRDGAITAVLTLSRDGQLPAACQGANARNGEGGAHLSRPTLYRWARVLEDQGPDALAPIEPPPAPMPSWLPQLLELYRQPGKPALAACVRDFPRHFPGLPAPTLRTAQARIAALPVEIRDWGRVGRRQMRAVQPFVRRSTEGLWPMDVVIVDGHMFKAYCRRPDNAGARIRPELTTYLDIATRRALGVSLWVAESQYAIWLALRAVVLNPAQGVPAIQYSDNGAYRGQEHQGILARIGTTQMLAQAYRPQARGAIERLNSSLWIPLAKTFPTYCGDDMDQELKTRALKKVDATGAGLIEWPEMVAKAQSALADYNDRPHSSLKDGRKTLSPNQAWARAVDEGWKPTLLEGDDLHDLLPALERTVQRAEITLPWGKYFAGELRFVEGEKVRVAYDPADGTRVWVSDMAGRLVTIAERGANVLPFVAENKMEHARAERAKNRIRLAESRAERIRSEESLLLEGQALDLPDLVIHTGHTGEDPRLAEARALLEAEFSAAPDPLDGLRTDPERYEAYKGLLQRQNAGEILTDREAGFVASFRGSDYCRLMQAMEAEFDAQMTGRGA